jgi:transposase-like protein
MAKDHRRQIEEVAQGVLLDDPAFLREIVERVLQVLLETEMAEHVGAAPYERTTERKGHPKGHTPRTLRTRVGTLNLLVPQDREGEQIHIQCLAPEPECVPQWPRNSL